jgi:hypothetical protein
MQWLKVVFLGLPRSLHDALNKLATEDKVKELEILIVSTLDAMILSDGDEVVLDFTENIDVSYWKSGIEEYDKCSEDDLWEHLGLSEKKLPFFQTHTDPDTALDPWSESGPGPSASMAPVGRHSEAN